MTDLEGNGVGFGSYVVLEYGVECAWCSTIGHSGDGQCGGCEWDSRAKAKRGAEQGGWKYNEDADEWTCPDEDCQAKYAGEVC